LPKIDLLFQLGTPFIKPEDCLELVETVIGGVVCGLLVEIGKDVIEHECEKHTPVPKIASEVADKVCNAAHFC
jgi:hypothetical protein